MASTAFENNLFEDHGLECAASVRSHGQVAKIIRGLSREGIRNKEIFIIIS